MIGKAVAVVSLLLTLAEGCGGNAPFQPGPANAACHIDAISVQANNPHQSKGTPTDIVGKVRATCTGNIDTLNIEAKLQRQDNGKWVDVPGAVGSRSVTPVVAEKEYTTQATMSCPPDGSTHQYRTGGKGSGTFGGKPAGSATWTYSKGVPVTCK